MNTYSINYDLVDNYSELPQEDRALVEQAYSVAKNAYAPYSKFHVGAAVLLDSGEVVLGSNQENAAFPSGLCAERVALFYAGANYPENEIVKIVIVAKGNFLPADKILSPCGSCRQVMLESEMRQKKTYQVILVSENGNTIIFNKAQDLLPFAFGLE